MAFSVPRKLETEEELYQYALGALGRRMRSVAEMKRLLRRRVHADGEHGQLLIEIVVRRLKDYKYLDDTQYAAAYSSLRRDNEKYGRRRVITELKMRGVHEDVISPAVDSAFQAVSEERQARDYLRRKRVAKPKDQKEIARVFRKLVRAGFTAKTVFLILKDWQVDEETLSALEGEFS